MNTQQIGKAGELLVQYQLLKLGIESSPLTTDSGIDLVAFSNQKNKPFTIQVKANEKPKPGGGKGALALDWWLRENSPTELVALVDLSHNRTWLFLHSTFAQLAQQKSNGKFHFYMYLSDDVSAKKRAKVCEFEEFLIENQVGSIFGV
ncbi:MAG: hypothetical protein PHH11_14010 [Methylomonas sp.]|nr:hypothetical protein [Methylomonas sp.]